MWGYARQVFSKLLAVASCLSRHINAIHLCLFICVQVVAVYKDDGQRGHHMDDFIPKEELAKFMAQCGDDKLAQQVRRSFMSCYISVTFGDS
jgi:hypothetical protein